MLGLKRTKEFRNKLGILEDKLRKVEFEFECLEERIKILECPHSNLEFIDRYIDTTLWVSIFVKRCKDCKKILKRYESEDEYLNDKKLYLEQTYQDKLIRIHKKLAKTEREQEKMNTQEFITKVREEFETTIAQKTGWGKNEIMRTFDLAILKVSFNELSKELENDK